VKIWSGSLGRTWSPSQVLAELRAGRDQPAIARLDRLATIRRTSRGATLRGRRRGEDWSVVIKLFSDAEGFERARRLYDHHLFAYGRCPPQSNLRVPEPLGLLAGLPGYAMRHVPGKSAWSIVRWNLLGRGRAREELLARAARWLRAYHGDPRWSRVSPGYLLSELEGKAAGCGLGREAPSFEVGLEALGDGARRLGPFRFPKAVVHGDFNFHNLVVDGEVTWAIDFAGAAGAIRPVTFDIACCLFFLEFRDGWTAADRAGTAGGFDRRAIEVFARHYPDLPWESAEAAWLMLHHQLRQWTSFEQLHMQRHAGRMAAACREAAATLAARLAGRA
jgi:hypothetical protein